MVAASCAVAGSRGRALSRPAPRTSSIAGTRADLAGTSVRFAIAASRASLSSYTGSATRKHLPRGTSGSEMESRLRYMPIDGVTAISWRSTRNRALPGLATLRVEKGT